MMSEMKFHTSHQVGVVRQQAPPSGCRARHPWSDVEGSWSRARRQPLTAPWPSRSPMNQGDLTWPHCGKVRARGTTCRLY